MQMVRHVQHATFLLSKVEFWLCGGLGAGAGNRDDPLSTSAINSVHSAHNKGCIYGGGDISIIVQEWSFVKKKIIGVLWR